MVWAIAYAHRYRSDPFFRVESTIGLLLGGYITTVAGLLFLMRNETVFLISVGVILVSTIFGYLIMSVALGHAEQTLRSQKEFISNLAHELRTPLSIIKTTMEVALMSSDISPAEAAMMRSIDVELERTSDIINNRLSLSSIFRLEAAKFSNVDLGDVVRAALGTLRALKEKRSTKVDLHITKNSLVWGNSGALEQIVMNIVKNAMTHSPKDGLVVIKVVPVHPGYVELSVRDSGTGISREHLSRIFEPYYRGDSSRKRVSGTTGLGLTIVSELVKEHKGKIAVQSAVPRGTVFTVLLPVGHAKALSTLSENHFRDKGSEVEIDYSVSS